MIAAVDAGHFQRLLDGHLPFVVFLVPHNSSLSWLRDCGNYRTNDEHNHGQSAHFTFLPFTAE